jgi:hypothetical protein
MPRCIFLLSVMVVMSVSCGAFAPRSTEYPSNTVTVDPLNFASILWGTGKEITKVDYNDIFFDSATFVDINDNFYDKKMLVDHLQDVIRRFVIDEISWKTDSLSDFPIADTFFADRTYHVVVRDTLMIPPKSYQFDNSASFKLIFNADKNTWNIFYFKDKFPGKSIFHPLFQPDY